MPDNQNEKKKIVDTVDGAMADSNPKETTEIKGEAVDSIWESYKDLILDVVKNTDKSAYVTVHNNDKTSDYIYDYLQRHSAVARIGFKSQLAHYENIAVEHTETKWLRQRINRKIKEQGEASLTDEERAALTTKTQLETMIESATKSYFIQERSNYFDLVSRELQYYTTKLISTPDRAKPDELKKSIKMQLDTFGKTKIWGKNGWENVELFTYSDRDVPKYIYDDAALDQYVNAYDKYVRANLVNIKREQDIREAGRTMVIKEEEFIRFGEDEKHQDIPLAQYTVAHDKIEKDYKDAKEKYENLVKDTEANPALRSHLTSPERMVVAELEYYESKYDGKRFDQIPDNEKPTYVAHKYDYVNGRGLSRIPPEERKWFDKGVAIQALPRVLEMEANLDKIEKTMQKVWEETRNTAEQPFQKKELEENRAILKAYKNYLLDGSDANRQKFEDEINKAYDNAKQQFKDNRDYRARFVIRSEQILRGDFTFVPMDSRKNAKAYGMTANWDKHTYTRDEMNELKKIPKSTAEKQYERAFSVHVTPIGRMAIDYEIQEEIENRPEYTLKEMGQSLTGADLENYKATIRDDKMEKFNEMADILNSEIKTAKDQLKSLTKKYGFFGRFFNQHYKNEKTMLENDIDFGSKKYDSELKKTKYDIYKTYQEKGLALTRKESKELNDIVKEATRNGNIKKWDEGRAQEKKRLDEMNAKWLEPDVVEEPVQATVTQLDLGDKLHKTVEKEETVQKTPDMTIEKEQKIKEENDLEK